MRRVTAAAAASATANICTTRSTDVSSSNHVSKPSAGTIRAFARVTNASGAAPRSGVKGNGAVRVLRNGEKARVARPTATKTTPCKLAICAASRKEVVYSGSSNAHAV
jgi:hypothetical protein